MNIKNNNNSPIIYDFRSGLKMFLLLMLCLAAPEIIKSQTYGRRFEDIRVGQIASMEPTKPKEMQELTFALERPINPEEYIMGPGDVLGINIQTADNITLTLTVSPTGAVLIPSVGIIKITQMSLANAIVAISQQIRHTYINADVYIALLNVRFFKIQITGAINNPGFYTVTPVSRLCDIINVSGGFKQLARDFDIQIKHSDGTVSSANYNNYLFNGELSDNPTFIEGDQVFVPYADIEKEGIVIRGAITGSGYDIIEEGELLAHYLARRSAFSSEADLQNVKISRKVDGKIVFLTVLPEQYTTTVLLAGDAIDILNERGVSVNGFVQTPGSFQYFPGFSAMDYVNLAGGNSIEGDVDKLFIRHLDGSVSQGKKPMINRGDVIIVPRAIKNVFFGNTSILQIAVSVFSVVLTYIAATK